MKAGGGLELILLYAKRVEVGRYLTQTLEYEYEYEYETLTILLIH